MKRNIYPFLKDPRAVSEIRRHKWLESEKAGAEVGFATAALDWITRYGEAWKAIHVKDATDYTVFLERRKFRRFKPATIIDLVKNGIAHTAQVIDVSVLGILCKTQKMFTPGERFDLKLSIIKPELCRIVCSGRIARSFPLNAVEYQIFLRFDEFGQRQIEQCAPLLK